MCLLMYILEIAAFCFRFLSRAIFLGLLRAFIVLLVVLCSSLFCSVLSIYVCLICSSFFVLKWLLRSSIFFGFRKALALLHYRRRKRMTWIPLVGG